MAHQALRYADCSILASPLRNGSLLRERETCCCWGARGRSPRFGSGYAGLCSDTFHTSLPTEQLALHHRVDQRAHAVVVACGGLSIPTLGATPFGYKIAEQFSIKVNPCRPGLVPLTLKDKDVTIFKELSGVALDTIVSFGNISFRENTLFTHKGLSGPAILQISSYWQPGNLPRSFCCR